MNYIREELLRQRMALARLLLGQGIAGETERTAAALERGTMALAESTAEAGTDPVSWAGWNGNWSGPSGTVYRLMGDAATGILDQAFVPSGDEERAAAWSGWDRGGTPGYAMPQAWAAEEASGLEQAQKWLGTAEGEKHGIRQLSITGAAGQRGGVLPSTDGTAARERIVTEVIWTGAGEGDGPKELSLVYQRDARRYDGGFSLY